MKGWGCTQALLNKQSDESQAMRILSVSTTFPRHRADTAPRFVLDLSAEMVQRGHQVRVVTPHSPGAARSEVIQGVEVRRYRYLWPESAQTLSNQALHTAMGTSWLARLKAIPFVGMMFWGVQAEILRFRPDLIHCHWLIPQGTFCAAIGKLNRIPVLVSMHGSDVFKYQTRLIDSVRRWTLKNVNASVANSSAVLRRAESIRGTQTPPIPTPTIPMGVDTRIFHPAHAGDQLRVRCGQTTGPILLAVGRLSPEKGFDYLLEALPQVLERFPTATLAVAGYGPCEQSLKSQAQSLNVSHAVRWLGPLRRDELAPLYASADAFVSPSVQVPGGPIEALGLVFIEAMASGTVPIGTSIGGIPDVIQHGVNGLLAQEKDPHDLACQIIRVLSNSAEREAMAANAIETAECRFSWNSVGDRYDSLYQNVHSRKAA